MTESNLNSDLKYFLNKVTIISIAPSGRSGSYFVQSILDSHENIVTIPFFVNVLRIYENIEKFITQDSIDTDRILNHVCRESIMKHYFYKEFDEDEKWWEGLKVLVNGEKKTFHVDVKKFKDYFKKILETLFEENKLSKRNFYFGVHLAWLYTIKRDPKKIIYIVDQTHNCTRFLQMYKLDSKTKFIHTIRDPRASSYSYREHNKFHSGNKYIFSPGVILSTYHYMYFSLALIHKYKLEWLKKENYFPIKLEDIHNSYNQVIKDISKWLEIKPSKKLFESSMNDYIWSASSFTHKKSIIGADKSSNDPKWKLNLNKSEIKKIEFLSSIFMDEFHYEKFYWNCKKGFFNSVVMSIKCLFNPDNDMRLFNLKNILNHTSDQLNEFSKFRTSFNFLLKKFKLRFLVAFVKVIISNFKNYFLLRLKIMLYLVKNKPYVCLRKK